MRQGTLPFDQSAQPAVARSRRHGRRGDQRQTTAATEAASNTAFEDVRKFRGKRYKAILWVVAQSGPELSACLTSLEVLRALHARGEVPNAINPNLVRPRLTEARDAGLLENPSSPGEFDDEGRPKPLLKEVHGDRPAAVWRLTPQGRLFLQTLISQKSEEM